MAIDYVSAPPRTTDLVVVGGGIVGAATAFFAGRSGLRTVLVERRPVLASLTTAAAAGGFRLQLESEEELRLVTESVELFANFAQATGQRDYDPAVRRQGYLWLTTTEEGAARQRRLVEMQRGWGLTDVEVLPGDEVRRRFPFVGPEVLQGRFRAEDGLIDPRSLAFGLTAGSGASVVTGCTVTGLTARSGGAAVVRTDRGAVSAGAVVVAAGPFSGALAEAAGVSLPVWALQRHKVVMPDVPEVPPGAPMTIDDDTGAHWRPAFAGALLLFTDPETAPSEPAESLTPDPGFAFRLLDPASPVAAARVAPFWRRVWERGSSPWMLQAGQYTMTPDRRPLIGPAGPDGVFVNTGYSGRGVMAGPAGSRLLVDLITGRLRPEEDPFRLDRAFDERPRLDPL